LSEDQIEEQSWLGVSICGSGQACVIQRAPVVSHFADPVRGDIQRPLAVAPAMSIALDHTIELARCWYSDRPVRHGHASFCSHFAKASDRWGCRFPADSPQTPRSEQSPWIQRRLAP
jgi:hypothetical protein